MNSSPFLCLISGAVLIATGLMVGASELPPLPTEYEADAIIRDEVATKAEKKRQHPIQTVEWMVLEQKIYRIDDGKRNLILRRVAKPELSEPSEEKAPPSYSEEDLAFMEEYNLSLREFFYLDRYQGKEHKVLSLSATVYDREITGIRWRHEGRDYTAWSTIDFNHLRGVRQFETADKVYSLYMGIGEEDGDSAAELPELPATTPGQAEYFLETEDPELLEDDDIFAPLDVLHVFYERNAELLEWEYERRQILNAARKRYREAHPPDPEDTIIHFWPKRSRRN